jgi:predicted Zn-dependent protease
MELAMARAALAALVLTACWSHAPVNNACANGADDRCIGWALDAVLMAKWTEYDDRALDAYVAKVGQRLVHAAGRNDRWTFRVIDLPDANGQANLDTTIYVTRGALARLRSEAELAGLLGHEIGHVLAGHGHEAIAERMREVPRTDGDRVMRAARDDEIQADELAVLLTWRAGYDPRAVETMLRALAAGDPRTEPDPDDTHPGWVERLARVHAFATHLSGGELGEQRYQTAIARLVIGDDPRDAAILDHTAVLARAGIAIDLPASADATTDDGSVDATLDGDSVRVQPISAQLAANIQASRTQDSITWTERGAHGAVIIVVAGPHQQRTADRLRAAIRPPRDGELAKLVPQYVDLKAPRQLWPD